LNSKREWENENFRGKKLCFIVAKDAQEKWCSKNLGIEEFSCKGR
jgi:hypothetical protein